jgi:hypothetical protein
MTRQGTARWGPLGPLGASQGRHRRGGRRRQRRAASAARHPSAQFICACHTPSPEHAKAKLKSSPRACLFAALFLASCAPGRNAFAPFWVAGNVQVGKCLSLRCAPLPFWGGMLLFSLLISAPWTMHFIGTSVVAPHWPALLQEGQALAPLPFGTSVLRRWGLTVAS